MGNCCCNTQRKRCYQFGVIFASIYIIVFEIVLSVFSKNSMKTDEIKDYILSERPLFDFQMSVEESIQGKTNVTFFEYKGDNIGGNGKKSFNRIYKYKFFYDGKERNYFDYINEYCVNSGENCPANRKKCGILDSKNRILCLPNNEECPLNGFYIASSLDNHFIDVDSDIHPIGVSYESTPSVYKYIYFTNKNVDGIIITEFKLSYGPPCAKGSELNWERYYYAETDQNYGCETVIDGSQFSQRYELVNDDDEGIRMEDLYNDNEITGVGKYNMYDNYKVDLYVRNYNEIDEKCVIKFLDDFEKDKKYFEPAYKASRILSLIGLFLILALFIFILTTSSCCCALNFHGIAMASPIYGLVANIVIVGIMNKERIKYECQVEGFNKKLDDAIIDAYGNITLNVVLSVLNIVFYSLALLFTVCLTFMRNKGMVNAVPIITPGISAFQGAYPQPAFPLAGYPPQYGQNIPYQNVMPGTVTVREKIK